jgi:hypothetical protein
MMQYYNWVNETAITTATIVLANRQIKASAATEAILFF